MSLEAAIDRNTAAIEKLIAMLSQNRQPEPVSTEPFDLERLYAEALAAAQAEAAKRPVGEPDPAPSAPAPASGATAALETADAATATETVTFETLKRRLLDLAAAKGKTAVNTALSAAGKTALRDVTPDQYEAVYAKAGELLG